jgi:hypothetical protein
LRVASLFKWDTPALGDEQPASSAAARANMATFPNRDREGADVQ